jgi:hypothetical protein
MSIRIRRVGPTLIACCAACTVEKPGDRYLDDEEHHALAAKFSQDFNSEGRGPSPQDPVHDQLRAIEESNNPAREWWDQTYGTQGPASARPAPVAEAGREVCLAAAVLMPDGYIVRGHRHSDCLKTAFYLNANANRWPGRTRITQGFLTSYGRFVTRTEGRQLQEAAGIQSVAPGGYRGDELYSEDLY